METERSIIETIVSTGAYVWWRRKATSRELLDEGFRLPSLDLRGVYPDGHEAFLALMQLNFADGRSEGHPSHTGSRMFRPPVVRSTSGGSIGK
jgi:hypothetical protein